MTLMYIERQSCILLEVVVKVCESNLPRYLHDMLETNVLSYNLRNDSIADLSKYNFFKHVKYSILYNEAARYGIL